MSDQVEEAAPDVTSDGPAPTTNLMTEALEATENQASPEQTETTDAVDAESQGEPAVVPESYTFEAPEGVDIDMDSAVVAAFSEHAKSLGASQEQAAAGFNSLVKAQQDHAVAQHQKLVDTWAQETRDHPELGGDNLRATMVKADQTLATFDKEGAAKALLTDFGLINHPAIISLLVGSRNAISEDQFLAGDVAEGKRERTAADFFGLSELT
jgi:hypothetical protein